MLAGIQHVTNLAIIYGYDFNEFHTFTYVLYTGAYPYRRETKSLTYQCGLNEPSKPMISDRDHNS